MPVPFLFINCFFIGRKSQLIIESGAVALVVFGEVCHPQGQGGICDASAISGFDVMR